MNQPKSSYRELADGTIEVLESREAYDNYTDDEDLTDAERKTANFLAEMNNKADGTGTLWIHKIDHGGAHLYVADIPIDKYDPMALERFISKTAGPGDYRIQARLKGRKGAAGNTMISIAETALNKSTGLVPYNEGAQEKGQNTELMLILQQMQQQQTQSMERLADALTQKRGTFEGVFDALKNMDADKLSLLIGLATPVVKNMFSKKDPFDELQKVLAITGDIRDLRGDQKDENSGLVGLGEQFLSAFAGMKREVPQRPPAQNPIISERPATQEDPQVGFMMRAIEPMIIELIKVARENGDPLAAAKEVLISVPENSAPKLVEFLERDDSIPVMANYQPNILTYAVWFSELRDCILGLYYGEIADPEPIHGVHRQEKGSGDPEINGEPQSDKQPGGDGGDVDPHGQTDQGGEN